MWVKTKQSWWPAQLERVSDASADVLASRPETAAGKAAVDALLVRLLGDTPSFQWIADSDDVFDFETGYRHKKPKKNSRPLVAALKEAFALLTEQGVDVELLKANAVAAAAAAAVAALSAPSMAEVVSPAAADVGVVTGKRKSRSATVAAAAAAAATAAAATTAGSVPKAAATATPRSSGKKRKAPPAAVVSRDKDERDSDDDDNNNNNNDNDDNNDNNNNDDDSHEHEKKAKLDDDDDEKADGAAAVPPTVAETAASGAPEDATTTVAPTAAAAATTTVVAKKKRGRGAGKKRLSDTSAGGDAVEDVASMRSSPTLGYGAVSPHVDGAGGAASMPPPAAVPVPARRKQQPRRKSMSDVGHVFESRLDLYKARVHDRAVGVFSGNELAGAESIILMRSSGTPLRVLRDDGDQIVIEIDCDDAAQASLLVGAFRASHAHARSVRIIRAWTLGGAHAPASGYRHDGFYGVVPAAAHNDGAVKREGGDSAVQRQWLLSKILVAAPPPATAPTSAPQPQPPIAGTALNL